MSNSAFSSFPSNNSSTTAIRPSNQRNDSHSSSTSKNSNHSLATQSLRNLNISSNNSQQKKLNSNSEVQSPLLSTNTSTTSSPTSDTSSPIINTPPPSNSTPKINSKYGSISQFDSLQTLLEQAGYKDTRILTPTSKINSNQLQIQQQQQQKKEGGKGSEKNKSADAMKSLESISNRNLGNLKGKVGGNGNGNTKNNGLEKRGWISRFNSWTGASNSSTSNSHEIESSIRDKENQVSTSSSFDPSLTSLPNDSSSRSPTVAQIEPKSKSKPKPNNSIIISSSTKEIDSEIQQNSMNSETKMIRSINGEMDIDGASSSKVEQSLTLIKKSPKKSKNRASISGGIKRSSSPSNQYSSSASSTTPSPSPSKRNRTRPNFSNNSSPNPSPTKSKHSSSKKKEKNSATKNNLWIASIAHHSSQQNHSKISSSNEEFRNHSGSSSKTVPSRMGIEKQFQGELKRLFSEEEKKVMNQSRNPVSNSSAKKSIDSPSGKNQKDKLTRSSTSNSIDKEIPKIKKQERPIPHTVSAIKGSGSGVRTIGTRALLKGGVGLGLGIGVEVGIGSQRRKAAVEKKEEITTEEIISGMKKSKSKGRITLMEAFDQENDDAIDGAVIEVGREEWKKSLKSSGLKNSDSFSSDASLRDDSSRKISSPSTSNPIVPDDQVSTSNTTTSPFLSPPNFRLALLSSTPAEPILSHRAAVALRNSDCLNLKPSFSLGIGLSNLGHERSVDSLRGLNKVKVEETLKGQDEEDGEMKVGNDGQTIQSSEQEVEVAEENSDFNSRNEIERRIIQKMNSIETLRKALNGHKESDVNQPNNSISSSQNFSEGTFSILNQTSKLLPSFSEAIKSKSSTDPSEWDASNSKSNNQQPKQVSSSPPTLTITSPRGFNSPKILDLASDEFKPKSFSPDTLLRKEMKIKPGLPGKRKKSTIPMSVKNNETVSSSSSSNLVGNGNEIQKKSSERGRNSKYSSARELAETFGNDNQSEINGDSKALPRKKRSKSRDNNETNSTSTSASTSTAYSEKSVPRIRGRQPLLLGKSYSSSIVPTKSSLDQSKNIRSGVGTLSGSDRIHQLRKDINDRNHKTLKNVTVPEIFNQNSSSSTSSDPFRNDGSTSTEEKKMTIKKWKSKTLPHRFSNPTKDPFFDEDSNISSSFDSPTNSPTLKKSISKSKIPIQISSLRNDLDLTSSNKSSSTSIHSSSSSECLPALTDNNIDSIQCRLPTSISGFSDLSDYKGEISPNKLDKRKNRFSKIAVKMNAIAAQNDITPDQSMEDLGDFDIHQERDEGKDPEQESPILKRTSRRIH